MNTPQHTKKPDKGAASGREERLVRPTSSGWWDWYEGAILGDETSEGYPERILISDGGTHVVCDEEYEQITGENPDKDGSHHNYWEMTETTPEMMPGLWVKANV